MTSKSSPSRSSSSLQSTKTIDSETTLYTGISQKAQKDYAAALGILQSRYGIGGGNIPSPKNTPSKKLATPISWSWSSSPSINLKSSGSSTASNSKQEDKRKS